MDNTFTTETQTGLEADMDTCTLNYYDDGFGNVTICADVMQQAERIAYFYTVDFE